MIFRRCIYFVVIAILACSCKNKYSNERDVVKSLRLFDEGSVLLREGFKLSFDDSLEGQEKYKSAIGIFNMAYNADTTNLQLGTYLSDLYFWTERYDSALIWQMRMFPFDSINSYKNNSEAIAGSYIFMANCNLYMGDIKNAENYYRMALTKQPGISIQLGSHLSNISDKIFSERSTAKVKELKRKGIDPCRYSVNILRLGLSLCETDKYFTEYLFPKDKLLEREKTCK